MDCKGWTLVVPDNGEITCSSLQEEQETCELVCAYNYAPDPDSKFTCSHGGSWLPTNNPTCEYDGSLTIIVVPVVIGGLVIIFLLGALYARASNRCQKKTRAHDDDVENGNASAMKRSGLMYMVKTKNRPGKIETDSVQSSPNRDQDKRKSTKTAKRRSLFKRKKRERPAKKSKRGNNKSIKNKISKRIRNRTSTNRNLWRKRIASLKSPWKKKGPRRVVGSPYGVGEASMCGDIHQKASSTTSYSETSSYCDTCSSRSSSSCDERAKHTSSSFKTQDKKVPPPRPPAPKFPAKKSSSKNCCNTLHGADISFMKREQKTSSSDSFSSDSDHESKHTHNVKRQKEVKSTKNNGVLSKEADKKTKKSGVNPYNNYPVAASDRQYQDFEHDYRKSGHIYDGGVYYPQYHPVKLYPIKPVHKAKEKEESKQKIAKEDPSTDKFSRGVPSGGVKYYTIKTDKSKIPKKNKRDSKLRRKSKSSSRIQRVHSQQNRLKRAKIKRRKDRKEQSRNVHKIAPATGQRKRKRHRGSETKSEKRRERKTTHHSSFSEED